MPHNKQNMGLTFLATSLIMFGSSNTMAAPCIPGAINFNQTSLKSYSSQDISKSYSVVEEGCSVYIDNNSWASTDPIYTIDENTILEFRYISSEDGEVHGIGFEPFGEPSGKGMFAIKGTQRDFGIQNYRYKKEGDYEIFTIPVGKYVTGYNLRLVLMMDQDTITGGNGYFDNIRIYPGTTAEPTPTARPVPTATPRPTPTATPAIPTPTPIVVGTPTPTPEPTSTPEPTPVNEDYGVEVIDNNTALYWVKNQDGWPTGEYYSCKNGDADCYAAELVNGRWERQHTGFSSGQEYTAVLKIPGFGADATPTWTFVWEGDGTSPGNGGGDGGSVGGPGVPPTTGIGGSRVVAPSEEAILPALDYGFDAATGQNFLVAGLASGDSFGYTLYTFAADTAGAGTSACNDGCVNAWPPLTIDSVESLIRPSRLVGDLDTITREDGSLQVTYNGAPLYLRSADTVPGQKDGASGTWPLSFVDQEPLQAKIYQDALKTPSNMGVAINGFGFSIEGSTVSFTKGASLAGTTNGDLSFFCSTDQINFEQVDMSSMGVATIPAACSSADQYWYFFRYALATSGSGAFGLDNNFDIDPTGAYVYTALYVDDGTRIDLGARAQFSDTGANWMRFRHPRSYDGVTEAIRDATHNSSRVADLARYSITSSESTAADGSVELVLDLNLPLDQGLVRLEGLENGAGDLKLPTWRFQFTPSNNQRTYTQGGFSYGQNISFEMTGVVGGVNSQSYNTYQYYTIGQGFYSPIGDPRLSLVGKGGTHMVYNLKNHDMEFKNGHTGAEISDAYMEHTAIFTQHLTTLERPEDVDNFLWGHHLFHGVKLQLSYLDDPAQDNLGSSPGDTGIGREIPEIKSGAPIACGDCHWRDGRGSHIIETAKGPRIAPPVYGIGLLQYIEGREAGFTWDGSIPTVRHQIKNALVSDHGIDPNNPEDISPRNLELISQYTEFLTVPARFPGVYEQPGVKEGDALFHETGCAECHTPMQKTSKHAPKMFRDIVIRPYTDMKVHKVYDGEYRTAPLWGLGRNIEMIESNNRAVRGELDWDLALKGTLEEQIEKHHLQDRALLFMHDGAARSLDDAILLHDSDGESDAAAAVSAYKGLSGAEKENIVQFLKSL